MMDLGAEAANSQFRSKDTSKKHEQLPLGAVRLTNEFCGMIHRATGVGARTARLLSHVTSDELQDTFQALA